MCWLLSFIWPWYAWSFMRIDLLLVCPDISTVSNSHPAFRSCSYSSRVSLTPCLWTKLVLCIGDVGVAMGKFYGNDFSQTTISRFEALNLRLVEEILFYCSHWTISFLAFPIDLFFVCRYQDTKYRGLLNFVAIWIIFCHFLRFHCYSNLSIKAKTTPCPDVSSCLKMHLLVRTLYSQ